jgi:hypothetical protein
LRKARHQTPDGVQPEAHNSETNHKVESSDRLPMHRPAVDQNDNPLLQRPREVADGSTPTKKFYEKIFTAFFRLKKRFTASRHYSQQAPFH